MLIYYVVGLLVYFGGLSLITQKSKYQPTYLKGGVIAMLVWPIIYLITSSAIIDKSILKTPTTGADPKDILAQQEQTVLIIGIITGLLLFIGLPILLKQRSIHRKK